MPSKIRLLDERTINQIAAGEVIENAASCIKELAENAVDAGATRIEVEIVAGGRKKIVVHDNGSGMNGEEILLSVQRHATSKIREAEDMFAIRSLGFRGEALAAVAAVSRLTIRSSDGGEATELVTAGGGSVTRSPSARNQGTTVEVNSLFFNVPVRLAFQHSLSYDIQEVTGTVTDLSLAYPEIAFKLTSDHKEIFSLSRQSNISFSEGVRHRIAELFGPETADSLQEFEESRGVLRLRGFLGLPNRHRPSGSAQYLFVNQRSVDSRLISLAVSEGYGTRLPVNRFPVFFLYLDLPPDLIDVNVHPRKKEIRFKDPLFLKREISGIVDEVLNIRPSSITVNPAMMKSLFAESRSEEPNDIVIFEKEKEEKEEKPFVREPVLEVVPHVLGIFDIFILLDARSLKSVLDMKDFSLDGIILMHQRRAEERILYDLLMKKQSPMAIQNLLLPEIVEFSQADALLLQEYLPLLEELGIGIRDMGSGSFLIDGLASVFRIADVKKLTEEIITDVRAYGFQKAVLFEKKSRLARSIAKLARGSQKMENPEEACRLVSKLLRCQNFYQSPKGKSIFIPVDRDELFKKFQ